MHACAANLEQIFPLCTPGSIYFANSRPSPNFTENYPPLFSSLCHSRQRKRRESRRYLLDHSRRDDSRKFLSFFFSFFHPFVLLLPFDSFRYRLNRVSRCVHTKLKFPSARYLSSLMNETFASVAYDFFSPFLFPPIPPRVFPSVRLRFHPFFFLSLYRLFFSDGLSIFFRREKRIRAS